MRSSGSSIENEIKLAVPSARHARRLLRSAGARLTHRRTLEVNLLFDRPDQSLRRAGTLIRLRWFGRRCRLTCKGPAIPGPHKARREWELDVSDGATLAEIFAQLGMAPSFRYEKYRSEWELPGSKGAITVDETPIGAYLELEGAAAWVDRTARKLGFTRDDYLTTSYVSLYLRFASRNGTDPHAMIFPR